MSVGKGAGCEDLEGGMTTEMRGLLQNCVSHMHGRFEGDATAVKMLLHLFVVCSSFFTEDEIK